jgi:hypothetical protein
MNYLVGKESVVGVIEAVKDLPVLRPDDLHFLQEKSAHLGQVMERTQMWRTDIQKASIINDVHFPTDHAKFHQAMLEQKVQFDQAMYLAKDFELKKLDIDEKELEYSELTDSPRDLIKKKRLEIELQFMRYELKQMQIAMQYRMQEVKGWQAIQEELLEKMRKNGMDEDSIWSKNDGELKAMFFLAMNNLQALPTTTDSAERSNLISLAMFTYQNAKRSGLIDQFKAEASKAVLDSIGFIEKSDVTF